MKKSSLLFIVSMLVFACGRQDGLETGSELYKLADALALKYPVLEPKENNVLVRTDEFDITTAEFFRSIRATDGLRTERMRFLSPKRLREVVEQRAEELATRRLLLLKARDANIVASEAEIDSTHKEEVRRLGGEDKFNERLQFYQLDLQDIQQEIRDNLVLSKYLEYVLADEIQVTEEEIEETYRLPKTATVRHILLKTNGKDDSTKAEIYKQMQKILARARAGEEFADLAREYSQDEGSKKRGGLYQDFEHGQMVKPFEDAAFSVPIGQISDIVETPYGYHIIKVIDRKTETKPLEEVAPDIRRALKAVKLEERKVPFISDLKAEAHLEVVGSS